MKLADIHLVLFLSRATHLRRWDEMGILGRELAIYKLMSNIFGSISIVTSGGEEELKYQQSTGIIKILYNCWGLSPNLYSLAAPILHRDTLRRATVYKSNQLDGAWTAALAGALHNKPVIVRVGYLWADTHRYMGGSGVKAALMDRLQAITIKRANALFVTTPTMKRQINQSYGIPAKKIKTIPNNVNTAIFHPLPDITPVKGRVCYIGRLEPVKNLRHLITAMAEIPRASLILIGEGSQRQELEKLVSDKRANVQFRGTLPHHQIPIEINRSEIYILPSLTEGHPKALIEALACGTAIVGTNVPGIRDLIQHGETGWLCETSSNSIQEAISELLVNPQLRKKLEQNARSYAVSNFSLDKIYELELTAIQGACEDQ